MSVIEECACVGCDGEAPVTSSTTRGWCPRCTGCGCAYGEPKCGETWDGDPTDPVDAVLAQLERLDPAARVAVLKLALMHAETDERRAAERATRERDERMRGQRGEGGYTLNGVPVTLAALAVANECFGAEEIAAMRALAVGASIDFGGGAFPSAIVVRVR